MAPETIAQRLDHVTQEHRLLQHPFYRAWAAGTLTSEDLAFYAGQYWRQVEAFPGYLSALAGRMDEGAGRAAIEANLSDEIDDDHPGLWRRFAAALDAGVLDEQPIEDETQRCVNAFTEACSERSLPFALGMLYAYESQTPEVAATKVEGLREHYGIDGPDAEYFRLHGELDVEHSRELAGVLAGVATDDAALAEAEAGARAGAQAVYGLLDGVARVRSISC